MLSVFKSSEETGLAEWERNQRAVAGGEANVWVYREYDLSSVGWGSLRVCKEITRRASPIRILYTSWRRVEGREEKATLKSIASRAISMQPVLLKFVVKSPATNTELLGRLLFVALGGAESHQDEFALDAIESHADVDLAGVT